MTITYNDLESQEVILLNGVDGNPIKIANGTSLSQAIDLRGFAMKSMLLPAAWTAATLCFQASADGISFFPWANDNSTTQTTVLPSFTLANAYVTMSNAAGGQPFILPRFLKLRSGTDASPVNQLADRIFSLVLMPDINRKP